LLWLSSSLLLCSRYGGEVHRQVAAAETWPPTPHVLCEEGVSIAGEATRDRSRVDLSSLFRFRWTCMRKQHRIRLKTSIQSRSGFCGLATDEAGHTTSQSRCRESLAPLLELHDTINSGRRCNFHHTELQLSLPPVSRPLCSPRGTESFIGQGSPSAEGDQARRPGRSQSRYREGVRRPRTEATCFERWWAEAQRSPSLLKPTSLSSVPWAE
jgi:hypothetical protein